MHKARRLRGRKELHRQPVPLTDTTSSNALAKGNARIASTERSLCARPRPRAARARHAALMTAAMSALCATAHAQSAPYPPQAYPPRAYPPQTYPPQAYPPQAYPPQSYPPPPQTWPPSATGYAHGAPGYGYAPPPRRSSDLTNVGAIQTLTSRVGYASGAWLGASIAPLVRVTDGRSRWGADVLPIELMHRLDAPEVGFRVTPIAFLFGLTGGRLWDGLSIRWAMIEVGGSYLSNRGAIHFGTAASLVYELEISDGFALRLFDAGLFVGLRAEDRDRPEPDTRILFDAGGTFGVGVILR